MLAFNITHVSGAYEHDCLWEIREEVNKFENLIIDKYLASIILLSFYFCREHILHHGFELHKIIEDLRLLMYGKNQQYPENLTMKR